MSAWWTKVDGKVERHDGRKPKLGAAITLNFAINMGGVPTALCGLYRRDPTKYPDEPNLLPAEITKARKRAGR